MVGVPDEGSRGIDIAAVGLEVAGERIGLGGSADRVGTGALVDAPVRQAAVVRRKGDDLLAFRHAVSGRTGVVDGLGARLVTPEVTVGGGVPVAGNGRESRRRGVTLRGGHRAARGKTGRAERVLAPPLVIEAITVGRGRSGCGRVVQCAEVAAHHRKGRQAVGIGRRVGLRNPDMPAPEDLAGGALGSDEGVAADQQVRRGEADIAAVVREFRDHPRSRLPQQFYRSDAADGGRGIATDRLEFVSAGFLDDVAVGRRVLAEVGRRTRIRAGIIAGIIAGIASGIGARVQPEHQVPQGLAQRPVRIVLAVLPDQAAEHALLLEVRHAVTDGLDILVARVHRSDGIAKVAALAGFVPPADVVSRHALALHRALLEGLAGISIRDGRRIDIVVAVAVEADAVVHPVIGNPLLVMVAFDAVGTAAGVVEAGTGVERRIVALLGRILRIRVAHRIGHHVDVVHPLQHFLVLHIVRAVVVVGRSGKADDPVLAERLPQILHQRCEVLLVRRVGAIVIDGAAALIGLRGVCRILPIEIHPVEAVLIAQADTLAAEEGALFVIFGHFGEAVGVLAPSADEQQEFQLGIAALVRGQAPHIVRSRRFDLQTAVAGLRVLEAGVADIDVRETADILQGREDALRRIFRKIGDRHRRLAEAGQALLIGIGRRIVRVIRSLGIVRVIGVIRNIRGRRGEDRSFFFLAAASREKGRHTGQTKAQNQYPGQFHKSAVYVVAPAGPVRARQT